MIHGAIGFAYFLFHPKIGDPKPKGKSLEEIEKKY
jgi:hypothetical protein